MNDLEKLKKTRRKARRLSREIMLRHMDLTDDAWVNSPANKAVILRGMCEGFDAEWNPATGKPGSHGSNVCRVLLCHWRAALRELKRIAVMEHLAAPDASQADSAHMEGQFAPPERLPRSWWLCARRHGDDDSPLPPGRR